VSKLATCSERRPIWLLLAVLGLGFSVSTRAQPDDDAFRTLVAEFGDANFLGKQAVAERLLDTGHPGVRDVLTALRDGRLFVRNRDQQPFIVESTDDRLSEFALLDPASLVGAGSAQPSRLSRVITNNQLRRFLGTVLPRFSLSSADADVRLDAVQQMLRSLDVAGHCQVNEPEAVLP